MIGLNPVCLIIINIIHKWFWFWSCYFKLWHPSRICSRMLSIFITVKPIQMTTSIRQPLSKVTNAESAQANSHTIVTV